MGKFCQVCQLPKKTQSGYYCKSCSAKLRQERLWANPGYRRNMEEKHKGHMPSNIEQIRKYSSTPESIARTILRNKTNPPHKGKCHSVKTKIKISMSKQGVSEWVGFNTTADRLERKRFRAMMQKAIFERDNYTCQICSIRGIDLQVDHILPWVKYPNLRFNEANCRTLCAKCHYNITFGYSMPKNIKGWGHNLLKGVQ